MSASVCVKGGPVLVCVYGSGWALKVGRWGVAPRAACHRVCVHRGSYHEVIVSIVDN